MRYSSTRRRFLAVTGASAAAALGGVASASQSDEPSPPDVNWTRQYQRAVASTAAGFAERPDEGRVLGGTVDLDDGSRKGWVFAVDEIGETDWGVTISGKTETRITDVAAAGEGEYVVAGTTEEPDDWQSRAGFLAGVADGDVQWTETFDDNSRGKEIFSLRRVDDGYVAAGRQIASNGRPAWLFRAGGDGSLDWERTYEPGSVNYFHDVIRTSSGYVAVGFTDAGEGSDWRGWVARFDDSGREWWSNRFRAGDGDETNGYNAFFGLTETVLGYLCVGATAQDRGEWIAWSVTVGRDQGDEIDRFRDGESEFSIFQTATGEERPLIGGRLVEADSGDRYGWIRRADSQGVPRWDKRVQGPVDGEVNDLATTDDGGFLWAGATNPAGSSSSAAWLGKLGGEPVPESAITDTATSTNETATGTRSGNGTGTATGTGVGDSTDANATAENATETVDGTPTSVIVTDEGENEAAVSGDGPGFGVGAAIAGLSGLLWRARTADEE